LEIYRTGIRFIIVSGDGLYGDLIMSFKVIYNNNCRVESGAWLVYVSSVVGSIQDSSQINSSKVCTGSSMACLVNMKVAQSCISSLRFSN
jgi:hypothetical protein